MLPGPTRTDWADAAATPIIPIAAMSAPALNIFCKPLLMWILLGPDGIENAPPRTGPDWKFLHFNSTCIGGGL
jgi:hypothetical protein